MGSATETAFHSERRHKGGNTSPDLQCRLEQRDVLATPRELPIDGMRKSYVDNPETWQYHCERDTTNLQSETKQESRSEYTWNNPIQRASTAVGKTAGSWEPNDKKHLGSKIASADTCPPEHSEAGGFEKIHQALEQQSARSECSADVQRTAIESVTKEEPASGVVQATWLSLGFDENSAGQEQIVKVFHASAPLDTSELCFVSLCSVESLYIL